MNLRKTLKNKFLKNSPKTPLTITAWVLLLVLVILVFGGFLFLKNQNSAIVASNKCDDTLWKFVHSPERLKILNKCIEVTGVIVFARDDPDGDVHLRLKLDKKFVNLLNSRNQTAEGGSLVLEPICENKPTRSYSIRTCQMYKGDITDQTSGSRVQVVGSYVFDKLHGWNEIHPVSSIKKLN